MATLKPNEGRAKTAILLVWIVLGTVILSGISSWMQFNLIQKIENGENVEMAAFAQNDLREMAVNILLLVASILSGIFFIMWFRRAYYNLSQTTKLVSYSDGWAAGAWFVPILNLFRPYQIMSELYTITPTVYRKKGIKAEIDINKGTIALWWTLWIISSITANISSRVTLFDQTINSFKIGFYFDALVTVLYIPLAFATAKIIKEYTTYAKHLKEIDNEMHFDAFVDDQL